MTRGDASQSMPEDASTQVGDAVASDIRAVDERSPAPDHPDSGPFNDGDSDLDAMSETRDEDTLDGSEVRDQDVFDASDAPEGGTTNTCMGCSLNLLPRPCLNHLYREPLTVQGGTPPYTWSASSFDGLSLEVDDTIPGHSRARVVGIPTAAGDLTVTVTDGDSKQFSTTYALKPRLHCWFAYVSLEGDEPRLHLVDPVLTTFAPPALSNNQRVNDFQFSSDGRYLAYRFDVDQGSPSSGHLSLLDLTTERDQALPFGEDSVTSYAWSNDALILAVSFQAQGTTFLGGIRRTGVAAGSDAGAPFGTDAGAAYDAADAADEPDTPVGNDGGEAGTPVLPGFTSLPRVIAPVDSSLAWFGTSGLGFFGPSDLVPGWQNAYYTLFDTDRFPIPTVIDYEYPPPVEMRVGSAGFFVVAPLAAPPVVFNVLDQGPPPIINNHGQNVVAPSGAFTAALSNDTLQLYRAIDDPSFGDNPWAQNNGCPTLLAWAKDQERLACVADVVDAAHRESHGEVRIFDLKNPLVRQLDVSPVLGACVKNINPSGPATVCSGSEYDYPQAKSVVRRRAFSRSGRWLAFTTVSTASTPADDFLYLADLQASPIVLKRKYQWPADIPSSAAIDLAFSADENLLLEQRGSALLHHVLNVSDPADNGANLLASDLEPPALCSEDFATAPSRWCGNIENAASFIWAPDPVLAAFKKTNLVTTVEFLPNNATVNGATSAGLAWHNFPIVDCRTRCSGQFDFQP